MLSSQLRSILLRILLSCSWFSQFFAGAHLSPTHSFCFLNRNLLSNNNQQKKTWETFESDEFPRFLSLLFFSFFVILSLSLHNHHHSFRHCCELSGWSLSLKLFLRMTLQQVLCPMYFNLIYCDKIFHNTSEDFFLQCWHFP